MGKGLGQPGVGHPEDTGPTQRRALPPVSPCLQKAIRGDPSLILCGCPEIIIILFGGLKQEVQDLLISRTWTSVGSCLTRPSLVFPYLCFTYTLQNRRCRWILSEKAPSNEILRPGLRDLKLQFLRGRNCAWLGGSALGRSGGV